MYMKRSSTPFTFWIPLRVTNKRIDLPGYRTLSIHLNSRALNGMKKQSKTFFNRLESRRNHPSKSKEAKFLDLPSAIFQSHFCLSWLFCIQLPLNLLAFVPIHRILSGLFQSIFNKRFNDYLKQNHILLYFGIECSQKLN